MLKDLRLASAAADAIGASAQFGQMATDAYERLSNDGHGGMDFSVVMKRLRHEL